MKWLDELPSFPFRDTGDIIHFTQDEYGKILVIDDDEHRILSFDSPFEQSCMSIRRPFQLVHLYTQYMIQVLAFIKPEHVTFLGLGGGSLLRTLHYLLSDCVFNAIEVRQTVVDIAVEFFDIPTSERVTLSVNDAVLFIQETANSSTDIIFSDMYSAYHMVEDQTQHDFMVQCSRALTNKGWLVMNLHSLPKNRESFLNMIQAVFPTVFLNTKNGNTILFASNSTSDSVHPDPLRIESIGRVLKQNFKQHLSQIHPINLT